MTVDVLMITHARAEYAAKALDRLLATADADTRVWLWHNGQDPATLEVVRARLDHPAVHEFHHSSENVGLREPTNWLWANARGRYVAKVDDDCLVEEGWTKRLAEAHEAYERFGVLGSWRYPDEDFRPGLAGKKIATFPGGHQVLQNLWVQGSGYLLKREWVQRHGLLAEGQTFTQYCKELAVRGGLVNGWYFPFVREEHMDDPRSPHTLLRSDADLERWLPLSAKRNGVRSVEEWTAQLRRSALIVQTASIDVRRYRGLRGRARKLWRRATGRTKW
jgi:glycosyltransferase involved in cell wall biosynthesis